MGNDLTMTLSNSAFVIFFADLNFYATVLDASNETGLQLLTFLGHKFVGMPVNFGFREVLTFGIVFQIDAGEAVLCSILSPFRFLYLNIQVRICLSEGIE